MKTSKLPEAPESASDQVGIGFSFELDWLRVRQESSVPIKWRSEAKPKKSYITYDSQLKTALKDLYTNTFGIKHSRCLGEIQWL